MVLPRSPVGTSASPRVTRSRRNVMPPAPEGLNLSDSPREPAADTTGDTAQPTSARPSSNQNPPQSPSEESSNEFDQTVHNDQTDGTFPAGQQGPADSESDLFRVVKILADALAPKSEASHSTTTPQLKLPDKFDGENSDKLRPFLATCQLAFLNQPSAFSTDRKRVLFAAALLTGRAIRWFEPFMSLVSNDDPEFLLNNWAKFEEQLLLLFGDPNEERNAENALLSLTMKDHGKAATYISDFRLLQTKTDFNETALKACFRRGLPDRILHQFPNTGKRLDTLQDLMDRALEVDNHHQDMLRNKKADNKPPLNNPRPPQLSSSGSSQARRNPGIPRRPLPNLNASGSTPRTPKREDNPVTKLLGKDGGLKTEVRAEREKNGLCMYCGGKHKIDECIKLQKRNAVSPPKN